MIYSTKYSFPIGFLTLASDGKNLIGLWIEDQKYFANDVKEKMIEQEELPLFIKTCPWLDKYFEGKKPKISDLFLTPKGTDFRKVV